MVVDFNLIGTRIKNKRRQAGLTHQLLPEALWYEQSLRLWHRSLLIFLPDNVGVFFRSPRGILFPRVEKESKTRCHLPAYRQT